MKRKSSAFGSSSRKWSSVWHGGAFRAAWFPVPGTDGAGGVALFLLANELVGLEGEHGRGQIPLAVTLQLLPQVGVPIRDRSGVNSLLMSLYIPFPPWLPIAFPRRPAAPRWRHGRECHPHVAIALEAVDDAFRACNRHLSCGSMRLGPVLRRVVASRETKPSALPACKTLARSTLSAFFGAAWVGSLTVSRGLSNP